MPSRPPPGTVGRPVVAQTNAFVMHWNRPSNNSGYVYHYDVISPLWDTGSRQFSLGNKKGTEIIMRLQHNVCPEIFNPLGAFDGKKNLFSFAEYRFRSQEFRVPWENRPSSNSPHKEVAVRIVFVKRIDVSTLHRLTQGDPNSIRPESDSSTAINMLNLFIQSTPRMTEPRIFNMKSFFTPHQKFTSQKIHPLELWRGHFQSVRPTLGKIVVNVDVTIGVILPADNLEKICAEYLHLRGIRDLSDLKESSIKKLRLFLKGVKVEVGLPGRSGKRPKTIKDVVPGVGKIKFDKGGERTSVAEHFAIAHRYTIRPGSLGVKLGSDGLFPMSVCKTVQQLYKNRSSPDVVREALEFFPRDPRQRLNAITAGWQELKYTQSPFLIGAGISVDPQPLSVQGRLLPSPTITFGGSQLAPQRQGTWDVMRRRFIKPAELPAWTVVDFANCDPLVLNTFITDLGQCMMERGMSVGSPHDIVRSPPNSKIAEVLETAGRLANANMILAILPESAPETYREIKRFGDITRGAVTQCVKWSRKLASDAQQRRANQYHNNLILKINAKLGGINYMPMNHAMEFLKSKPTMVIGADVSHPAPGSLLPSISALAASMDERLCKYTASIRVQASRTEIIQDLSEMFKIALTTFYKVHTICPQRIFVFRDGVSEGEFQTVLDKEVDAMKDVLPETYGPNQAKWPELTFIIVGKRHHFRFFGNAESQDPKGNGNLYSGFVVDQDIIHPVYQDFYLQSQPGLKGTSRPSHYTVLRNGSNLTSDQLQEIAYALCHCYSRATRSVKIPAPVYYADLVCRRAKFHFSDDVGNVDEMSVTSDEEHHLDHFKEHFSDINARMRNSMYFV